MRPVAPPVAVEVFCDGEWRPGWLHAWREDEDGWAAFVHYTVDLGATNAEWCDEAEVRQITASRLPAPRRSSKRHPPQGSPQAMTVRSRSARP